MRVRSSGQSARRFAVSLVILALAGACITAATWAAPSGDEVQPVNATSVETSVVAASDSAANLTHAEWLTANPRPEELVPELRATQPPPAMSTEGDALTADLSEPARLGFFPDAPILDFFPCWGVDSGDAYRPVDVVASSSTTTYSVYDGGLESDSNIRLTKNVGDEVWTKFYDGPANGDDYAGAVTVRGSAVYVAGDRETSNGDSDLILMRWNTSGTRIWTRSYDSGDHGWEIATDVAVDGDGNVAVTGLSASRAGGWDWVVASYRADGTRRWVRRYDGPSHLEDAPLRVYIDSTGRIYVCGYSESATNGLDAMLIKYSQSGDRLWARRVNGGGNAVDVFQGMTARPGGGVYVAGGTTNAAGMVCGLLRGYATDGSLPLTLVDAGGDEGPLSEGVYYNDVTVSGMVYCGGSQYVPETGWQRLLVAVDPYDAYAWREVELCPASPWGCEVMAVARDGQGGVFAAGTWVSDGGASQFLVERINRSGTSWKSVWPTEYSLPLDPDGYNSIVAMAVKGVNAFTFGQYHRDSTQDRVFYLGYVY